MRFRKGGRRLEHFTKVQVRSPRVAWRRHIGEILEQWVALQHRFFIRIGESAYCYSERANISLLSAATWHCHHIAMEEFAIRRGNGWRGPGRADLFMQIGRWSLCVEAKLAWLALPHTAHDWRTFWRVVRGHTRAAQHEAVRISRAAFQYRLGIVFCVLSARLREAARVQDAFIRDLNEQTEQQSFDFLAAYLPMSAAPSRKTTRCFPGVILVGSATRF